MSVLVAVCLVVGLLAGPVSPGSPAGAATTTAHGEVLIDEVGGHVLVTAGDVVDVYDLDGRLRHTIPDQFGANDLLLRGRTIYVVAQSVSRINVIDADTLTMTGGWSVAVTPKPASLAWAGDRIWFTYGQQWDGGLASLDPATGAIAPDVTGVRAGGDVAGTDSPARVYVLDRGLSPSKVRSFDVSTGTPVALATSPHSNACANGRELALAVSGDKAWTGCGAPYEFNEFDTATLAEPAVSYPAEPYPNAVHRSDDGAFLLGGTWSPYGPDLHLFEVDRPVALRRLEIGASRLAAGMVAVSSGGHHVYAVSEDGVLHTWVLSPTVTEVAPAEVLRGVASEISIHGTGFSDVTSLTVGGEDLPFVVASDEIIRAEAPATLPEGAHPLVLTSRWGVNPPSAASMLTVRPSWLPFASWSDATVVLHEWLVGRPPTDLERTQWVATLGTGTATLGSLVASLRASPDNVGVVDPVVRLYSAYFLRIPDRDGTRYWVDRRRGGTSLKQVADFFAASPEFQQRYGALSDRQFVDLIYQNILGRPGEEAGVEYWTEQLSSGRRSRGWVMVGFSDSPEHQSRQRHEASAAALWILLGDITPSVAQRDAVADALRAGTPLETVADDLLRDPAVAAHAAG